MSRATTPHARAAPLATALALLMTAAPSHAQTAAPPARFPTLPPGQTCVWTTLPALEDHAKIEAFDPTRKTTDEHPEDDDDTWRTLCVAPCALWIAPGTRLRVNGDFRVGAPFTLPVTPRVGLAVAPGKVALGVVTMSVSGGVIVTAALVYMLSTIHLSAYPKTAEDERDERQNRILFFGVAGIGLLGMGTGLALILKNRTSTVDLRTRGNPPRVAIAQGLSLSPAGLHF